MNKASVELAKSSADNLRANAAASFKADPAELRIAAQTEFLTAFEYRKNGAFFRLAEKLHQPVPCARRVRRYKTASE